jgi:tripartite-type tricarboxylate transporter receptor subunit TctC
MRWLLLNKGASMLKRAALFVLSVFLACHEAPAYSQAFPDRPVTIVVPFAAGGPLDTYARLLAGPMSASLGQSIIIENVTGASGTIGVGKVVRAPADGYTLSIGNFGSHVANAAIFTLPYDMLVDLQPIGRIAGAPQFIISRKSLPANSLSELVTWLQGNGNKTTIGTGGIGSPQHIGGLFFEQATKAQFQFISYRGAAPAMQDMLGGRIDIMIDPPTNSIPQLKADTIKVYAVADHHRLSVAPNVPTVDEAGLPGFYFSVWSGMWAPKGTPMTVVQKLNAALKDALADPKVRTEFADLGQEIVPLELQTPEALADYQKAEIAKWSPIIKAAEIKGE